MFYVCTATSAVALLLSLTLYDKEMVYDDDNSDLVEVTIEKVDKNGNKGNVVSSMRRATLKDSNRAGSIFEEGVVDFQASDLNGEFGEAILSYKQIEQRRQNNIVRRGISLIEEKRRSNTYLINEEEYLKTTLYPDLEQVKEIPNY